MVGGVTSTTMELDAIDASLRRRFRVAQTEVPIRGHALSLLHPASAEELINEADFERDERLPYWAELWPSSRVLGARVLEETGNGRSLLELGCGSGLVSTCAALARFHVCVSDYYEDAVRFARLNVWRNAHCVARGLMLDWRRLPIDLPRFDVVVASDVLYERPYGALVARVIAAALGPGGTAIVADPGRVGRDDFIREIGRVGLEIVAKRHERFVDGQIRQQIAIYEIGWHQSSR